MSKDHKTYDKVKKALVSGQYQLAINLLNTLLKRFPENSEYLLSMGEAKMRNEEFPEAVTYFARVVSQDKFNIRALNNFGAALVRSRHLEEAREILHYA